MENLENNPKSLKNISSDDILKALDNFGERSQLGGSTSCDDQAKAINRDSGLSESCSSFISERPLSITSDGALNLSDNEHLYEFQSDGSFSAISDPLGVCSSTTSEGEEDNEVHYFETKPWDEKQKLEREWELLFGCDNYFSELSQYALGGKLRTSKFRSIAWKMFLDCLPEDHKEWASKTKQLREEYGRFKQKNLIDPTKSKEDAESLDILHPLSLDESSPWKQFFKDNELKAVIQQDLDRLYPEIEFFSSSKVKEIMLNLLFCYAKKNKALGYKQGMHELLAPIVYVLENDSKSHRYLESNILDTVRCIMDPGFVEHDAFAMFCQLMEVTETWYQLKTQNTENCNPHTKFVGKSEPFAEPITAPPTAIVKKLNKIQDHLLRKHDTDLWFHLKELNVAPQVYGLRWVRLLFSREFPFQDVLVIWDALFAEGSHLDLVEYFYIVMLQAIRSKLMAGNYATCMSYLMKFPHMNDDVQVYIKRAINLRGTKKSRPNSRGRQPRTPVLTTSKGPHQGSQETVAKQKVFEGRPKSALANFTKRYTSGLVEPKHPSLPSNASKQDHMKSGEAKEMVHKPQRGTGRSDSLLSPPLSRERTDCTGSTPGRTMKLLGNELKTKLTRPRSRSRHGVEELEKDHQRLQVQVSHLNNEIERLQSMYLYCGRKLDSYIGLLQEEVTKDSEADRDVVYLSLAGLKQVRDLLKGTLSFRGSSVETEKDFIDIDKGIASRLQVSSPNVHEKQIPDEIPVPLLGNDNHYNCTPSSENLTTLSNAVKELDPSGCDSQQVDHTAKESGTEQEILSCSTTDERMECNQSGPKKQAEYPNLLESHETYNGSNDRCGGQDLSDSLQMNLSTPPESLASSLDGYLEEHFSNLKQHVGITTVPCTAGSLTNNPSQPSRERDSFNRTLVPGINDSQNKGYENKSNISTPEETLEGEFVFVNKDGTARSTHASPRISPTHPLASNDDDDDDDGDC